MLINLQENKVSLVITDNCINCRACDMICPSNAIYPGGKNYEINNTKHKALVRDHYYIINDKCNLCEGFHEEPECISICPMDAIIKVKKEIKEVINV